MLGLPSRLYFTRAYKVSAMCVCYPGNLTGVCPSNVCAPLFLPFRHPHGIITCIVLTAINGYDMVCALPQARS